MMTPQMSLAQFLQVVEGFTAVSIVPHNDPDPDAIASAMAVRALLNHYDIECELFYKGQIGRAENKALIRFLNFPLRPLDHTLAPPIILVDTQPSLRNNPIPADVPVLAVFDHHPWHEETARIPFFDVRPDYGSASALLVGYLQMAQIVPDALLATALFYGIKTDTRDLSRGASPADVAAYDWLKPLIDFQALKQIEQAQVSADYFRFTLLALRSARLYDYLLFTYIGDMPYPDLAGELADLLMRFEQAKYAVCVGSFQGALYFSVRTTSAKGESGALAQAIAASDGAGGGHATMAGGQLALNGRLAPNLIKKLRQRALDYLQISTAVPGKKLLHII